LQHLTTAMTFPQIICLPPEPVFRAVPVDDFGIPESDAGKHDLLPVADTLLDEGNRGAARDALTESLTIYTELGERAAVPYLLDDFSAVLSHEGHAEMSLQLAGAAEALREEIGMQLSPGERERFEHLRARARSSLDGEAAAAAWNAGRNMSLERAVRIALGETPPLQPGAPSPS
jgi:hypothetical protein